MYPFSIPGRLKSAWNDINHCKDIPHAKNDPQNDDNKVDIEVNAASTKNGQQNVADVLSTPLDKMINSLPLK